MAHKEPHPDHDLIQGEWTEKTLVEKLLEPVEKPAPRPWKVVLAVGGGLDLGLALCHLRHLREGPRHLGHQPARGLGV